MTPLVETISPSCCMRNKVRLIDRVYDDLQILSLLVITYPTTWFLGFYTVSLFSFLGIYVTITHLCYLSSSLHEKTIHTNQYDELDTSCDSQGSEVGETEELSQKQQEQGATVANPVSEDQESMVKSQLQKVVSETRQRNAKRILNSDIAHSPRLVPADTEFDNMPPLEPIQPRRTPRFSKSHYLHGVDDDHLD